MINNSAQQDLHTLLLELEKKSLNPTKLDKLLVSKDIKINMPLDNTSKKTILHKMIEDNKVLSAKWLLDNHANPYSEDSACTPAFFTFASHARNSEMFKLLVKYNIDFNYKNSYGRIVLQDIVLNGDVVLAKKVLPHTKNPLSLDKYGKNVLFDALSSGSEELVELLYALPKINVNIQTKEKDSLLHYVKDGKLDLIEFLLTQEVSPTLQDMQGKNIIFYLSERMEKSVILSEISKISKIIDLALRSKDAIGQKNLKGDTLLLGFLKTLNKPLGQYNQKKMLSKLIATFIQSGINIDEQDDEGNTALIVAIQKNDLVTVRLLLGEGADVNLQNAQGSTPLSVAVMKGDKDFFDMVQLLLSFDANPNIKDPKGLTLIEKILYILIYVYNYENVSVPFTLSDVFQDEENEDEILAFNQDDYMRNILEMMVSHDIADLSILDSQNNPYLFILILTQNDVLARMLIHNGADINQTNQSKQNILQYYLEFAQKNKIELKALSKRLKEIVKFGVDLDYRDDTGGSVLHYTILKHPLDITKSMHHCGAQIDVIDYKGRTLLHNAIWVHDIQTIRYILKNNPELINTPDKLGVLPINYAAFIGSKELICYLIKEDAYVNNIHEIPVYAQNFLKRFHKNIIKLEQLPGMTIEEKKDISILLKNMRKEFNIVD
ncbi:MAG: ankyrin repeat domain-containing protein [Campylobacterota bacterium]|nr:ankyrin repeat domain-containing protein [Campylobacterota bacterium]